MISGIGKELKITFTRMGQNSTSRPNLRMKPSYSTGASGPGTVGLAHWCSSGATRHDAVVHVRGHRHGVDNSEPTLAEAQLQLHQWTPRGMEHRPGKAVRTGTHQNSVVVDLTGALRWHGNGDR
jgi:hypothetical protein